VNQVRAIDFITQGESNSIALVRTRKGYLLSEGGVDTGEDLKAALRREIMEETGYESRILGPLGCAVEYLYEGGGRVHYRKVGHFFCAHLTGKIAEPSDKDHELVVFRAGEHQEPGEGVSGLGRSASLAKLGVSGGTMRDLVTPDSRWLEASFRRRTALAAGRDFFGVKHASSRCLKGLQASCGCAR
jgi:ADP-ribose pyrophosphatase YjhB (NUDIX family)